MQKMKKTAAEGSEFFICFTSRPSSSSKSLMSPNRSNSSSSAAAATPSLSSSLSRRLRSSGSIKGGQSPMFPAAAAAAAGGKKKGCAFEAAEPSSPKVTCIGQVRVKSKKKKLKNKNLVSSRSRSGRFAGGEASFRRDGGRKHVLNCFVPCGWSGCRGEGEKREKRGRSRSSTTCGAVFVRWLMQESEEEEKRREFVGLVVEERGGRGGEMGLFVREKEVEEVFKRREEEVMVVRKEEEEEDEEEEKVSLCIPPRNALLLMRCRSDPVRMAALANRSWDMPVMKVECEVEEEEVEDKDEVKLVVKEKGEEVVENGVDEEKLEEVMEEEEVSEEKREVEQTCLDVEEVEKEVVVDEGKSERDALVVGLEDEKFVVEEAKEKEEILPEIPQDVAELEETMVVDESGENELIKEALHVPRVEEEVEIKLRRSISCSATKSNEFTKSKEGGKRRSFSYKEKKERRHSFSIEREARRHSFCSEKEARRSSFSVDKEGKRRWSFSIEKENLGPKEKPVIQSVEQPKKEAVAVKEEVKPVEPKIIEETQVTAVVEAREKPMVRKGGEHQVVEREKKGRELPDCLLLMMYEPKLSMEVSKETWVCSTDFLHWRPNYNPPPNQPNQPSEAKAKPNAGDNKEENKKCSESNNVVPVPTANSAMIPQPPSKSPPTVTAIELKQLKSSAVGPLPQPPYEHFVLTRCKSEPVKSSARLAPESCFWKARHQPIGAAGLGF